MAKYKIAWLPGDLEEAIAAVILWCQATLPDTNSGQRYRETVGQSRPTARNNILLQGRNPRYGFHQEVDAAEVTMSGPESA